jgi:glyoxylase-like metal-dependent hydrolase (beta-lactamase superfamily II)
MPNTEFTNPMTDPIEIAPNTFWVGRREPGAIFYANPYLRSFPAKNGNGRDFHLLIDPGSNKDFAFVRSKSEKVIGDISRVEGVFINHQDPDVGSAIGLMVGRFTPDCHVLCSEDTWRLVQYYNVPRERFVAVEKFPHGFKLPNEERILPVPSPFCHFVGAWMLYDPQTRVLFTGDLFGSLTDKNAEGMYADESDWAGMRAFHQIYMPTNKALALAVQRIRTLTPAVELIAPQHGRLIRGPWLQEFMNRIERLPVGLDILDDRNASATDLRAWNEVLQRVVGVARGFTGDRVDTLLYEHPELKGLIEKDGNRPKIVGMGRSSVETALRVLCEHLAPSAADPVRYEAITAALEMDLPSPSIELDEVDGGAPKQTGSNPSPRAFASAGE